MKKLLAALRKADEEYGLLDSTDKIAVGLSGGKDSFVLLKTLYLYRMYMKKNYELVSITVDLGFEGFDTGRIEAFAEELGVPHKTVKTQIGDIVFNVRKETNPCALCAKMRKGALYEEAKAQGCNKAAFAHHIDDTIETFFMSMIYEGRMHTFSPRTYLTRSDITLIRPLILARENDIRKYAEKENMPVTKNPCPASGYTKRQEAKEELARLYTIRYGAKEAIENAIRTGLLTVKETKEDDEL